MPHELRHFANRLFSMSIRRAFLIYPFHFSIFCCPFAGLVWYKGEHPRLSLGGASLEVHKHHYRKRNKIQDPNTNINTTIDAMNEESITHEEETPAIDTDTYTHTNTPTKDMGISIYIPNVQSGQNKL